MRKPKLYQCRFCTSAPALRFRHLKAHERSNHPLALKADKAARKAQRDIYDQAKLVDEWQDTPITITIVIATQSYNADRNRSVVINETYRATVHHLGALPKWVRIDARESASPGIPTFPGLCSADLVGSDTGWVDGRNRKEWEKLAKKAIAEIVAHPVLPRSARNPNCKLGTGTYTHAPRKRKSRSKPEVDGHSGREPTNG